MITDLLRNDIGKISHYGSVSVPEFLSHKSLPQVHHLYSHIQGQLRSGLSHLEALKSCFPGGSVTGAPKIRSMEIIDNIEPVTRGPYTGALGYLGFNQVSKFNILIRTAIIENNRVHFPVGAGIVADSDPLMEYNETWHKARAFIQLIQGEQGIPFDQVENPN
jgi:para-aminobenzoate synthetase component 1